MNGTDFSRLKRILLTLGVTAVCSVWVAEELGVLRVAPTAPPVPAEPLLPASAPAGLVLQGVIAGTGNAPGMALLAQAGRAPVLVPEGAPYNENLLLVRVLSDRVVLRQRDSTLSIVLPLTVDPAGDPLGRALSGALDQPAAAAGAAREELPPAPAAARSRPAPP